ncbi:hypothetical protein Vi05172_g9529 [Venturia inaequalis]|nr:hypothetical protein Vi05172_g9529 [Venturia inaequalis]
MIFKPSYLLLALSTLLITVSASCSFDLSACRKKCGGYCETEPITGRYCCSDLGTK